MLTTVDPQERTWRSGVRSAMCVTSQLPGRGRLMWMMPLHLHVNQKAYYDDNSNMMTSVRNKGYSVTLQYFKLNLLQS